MWRPAARLAAVPGSPKISQMAPHLVRMRPAFGVEFSVARAKAEDNSSGNTEIFLSFPTEARNE
jgi:hypothetical protein